MGFIKGFFLVIVIAASGAASFHFIFQKPCDSPIEYRIGAVSAGFRMSETDFLGAVQEAEAIWEKAAGRDLFAYDPAGDMPISLIYDERQKLSDTNRAIESSINTTGKSAESVKAELDAVKSRFEKAKSSYEAAVATFEQKQSTHSQQVAYWNGKGGAPEGEYQRLVKSKAEIDRSYDALEAQRLQVNALSEQAAQLVEEYNRLVRQINSGIEVINKSADAEFEQGEYIVEGGRQQIRIYEFDDRDHLIRVLAHELGHALGIDHNDDPESVMYYLNSNEGLALSYADISALKVACAIN